MREKTLIRPVTSRALKSAGDTLRPYLSDSHCLDLFAGLGRFGETALKEGAASVLFVEKNAGAISDLKKLIERYAGRAEIFQADAFKFLENPPRRFDVIFADPPFPFWTSDFEQKLFSALLTAVNDSSIFLVKHPSRMVPSLSPFEFHRWKMSRVGDSALSYFTYGKKDK